MRGSELTIFIVEDSPLVMQRLIESISEVPGAKVVGSAAAVPDALEGVLLHEPRVLILDIQLRGGSCFALLKQMRTRGLRRPEVIIVVTNYPTEVYRDASRACGVDHFLDKASEFHKVREILLSHPLAAP
ncbi:MAG TPA: response regulator [Steroidobacter sp.]